MHDLQSHKGGRDYIINANPRQDRYSLKLDFSVYILGKGLSIGVSHIVKESIIPHHMSIDIPNNGKCFVSNPYVKMPY